MFISQVYYTHLYKTTHFLNNSCICRQFQVMISASEIEQVFIVTNHRVNFLYLYIQKKKTQDKDVVKTIRHNG